MPVTLHEKSRLGNLSVWRNNPDRSAVVRLRMTLASVLAGLERSDLYEWLIICPSDQVRAIQGIVKSITEDSRIRVLPEMEVCPDIKLAVDPKTGNMRGWFAQQMLKLAASEQIQTPFYLTCDSDIVCFRKWNFSSLISDGRAICGIENTELYQKMYTTDFAEKEAHFKQNRMLGAQRLLRMQRPESCRGRFYSETPLVFHTESVRDMLNHLTHEHGYSWTNVLASDTSWTEIALYFLYLEHTGMLNNHHRLEGHNCVLHLEGSVWHPREHYASPRLLDETHFNHLRNQQEGIFLAIQSYLNPATWLPDTGFSTVNAFYRSLANILDLQAEQIAPTFYQRWSAPFRRS